MVTITIKDHVPHCFNNNDGQIVLNLIMPHLQQAEPVEVSFEGVYSATSSFVNSAFIDLLEHFDFEQIKRLLSITHSNAHINGLIKQRFASTQAARKYDA